MPPYNPLAEFVKALIQLPFEILFLPFRLLGFVRRTRGGRQLGPYEQNRQRATMAAFVAVLCAYVLHIGGWPLNQLPPWVPIALTALAGLALLLVLAGVVGARAAPDALRDPLGMVLSLVIAGGGYALLRGQWYVPRNYFAADYVSADYINRLLPGLYIGLIAAGLARALICLNPFGNARQRTPFDIARGRAVGAAFLSVLCLYVLRDDVYVALGLMDRLPPWVPLALLAVAGLLLLVMGFGINGAHKTGQRDPHGALISLAVAASAAALIWWRWQLPSDDPAVEVVVRLLPGLYFAVLLAALVRALICLHLLGGAGRIIARLWRRRARPMRAAASRGSGGSGFWAEMRDSFARGRAGLRWLE
jgi:hypothetical protein